MSSQNIAHPLIGDLVTQIGERSDDSIVTPTGILTRQFHDQLFDRRVDSRSSS